MASKKGFGTTMRAIAFEVGRPKLFRATFRPLGVETFDSSLEDRTEPTLHEFFQYTEQSPITSIDIEIVSVRVLFDPAPCAAISKLLIPR